MGRNITAYLFDWTGCSSIFSIYSRICLKCDKSQSISMDTASSLVWSAVYHGKKRSQKARHLQRLLKDLPGRKRSSSNIQKGSPPKHYVPVYV